MRSILILILTLIGSQLNAQSGDIQLLSHQSLVVDMGTNHPQMITNANGEPVIIWTDPLSEHLYCLTDLDFGLPKQLNPVGVPVQSYDWSGPDLARSGNNVYVVFKELGYDTGNIYLVKSTDNGATFGDTLRVDDPNGGFPQYPDIAVYQDTIWVTYMEHDAMGMHPNYVVRRSTNGGASFEAPVVAGALWGDEACDCCQPEIVANGQYVVLLFRNNATNVRDIKAVVSTDRGQTFNQLVSVDDHNWVINSCPSTGPDAYLDGNMLYTTYKTIINNKGQVVISAYDLAAGNLAQEIVAGDSTLPTTSNYPQMASNGQELFVVYESTGTNRDIFISGQYQHGMQLQAEDVSYNLNNEAGAQTKPDIAINDMGTFYVVYASGDTLFLNTYARSQGLAEKKQEEKVLKTLSLSLSNHPEWKVEGQTQAAIYDQNGRKIRETRENEALNFTGFTPGLYFCIAKGPQGEIRQLIRLIP